MIITNLLTNMVVVGLTGLFPTDYSTIPAFREYVFNATFQQASNMIVAWNLDLPRPITTNMITKFITRPHLDGPNCTMVFSNRFTFGWGEGKFDQFNDGLYIRERTLSPDVDANDALLEQWMRATNLLTMEKAEQMAESVLHFLGVPSNVQRFSKPQKARQMHYTWKDGKKYPMPYYGFWWETNGFNFGSGRYEIQVSGIISNVVYCSILRVAPYVKTIRPMDYFELLSVPTNAVFVWRLPSAKGQPPIYELYTNYADIKSDR